MACTEFFCDTCNESTIYEFPKNAETRLELHLGSYPGHKSGTRQPIYIAGSETARLKVENRALRNALETCRRVLDEIWVDSDGEHRLWAKDQKDAIAQADDALEKMEEYLMKSGFHDHFCREHKAGFVCHKVTHCNDSFETKCLDCRVKDEMSHLEQKVNASRASRIDEKNYFRMRPKD